MVLNQHSMFVIIEFLFKIGAGRVGCKYAFKLKKNQVLTKK